MLNDKWYVKNQVCFIVIGMQCLGSMGAHICIIDCVIGVGIVFWFIFIKHE